MINGSYTPYPVQYYSMQPNFPQPYSNLSASPQAASKPMTSQMLNTYQQEIQKLKTDKKFSDFYITGMAIASILGAIASFIASRTKDIRL